MKDNLDNLEDVNENIEEDNTEKIMMKRYQLKQKLKEK